MSNAILRYFLQLKKPLHQLYGALASDLVAPKVLASCLFSKQISEESKCATASKD